MQLIFFLCLLSSFHAATEIHPSNGKQIHQVIFQNDKLFYISRLNREFGIMLIDNRVVVSQYRLAEEQSILKVDEHLKKLILRKGRDKVLVFKLKTLDIAEVQIEIAFNHQKIIDFIQIEDKIFVSTEKDVRIYSKTDQMKQDHPKNIITSGRKRQVFRKIFLNTIDGQQHLSLIFSRDQQICLRKVFHNKTQTQSCLFNVSSQLQEIQRMGSNYLIQTATLNYVIKQDQTFYSFKGFITQIDDRFAVMSSQFKTFDILRQTSLEGIAVIGSQVNQTFWIRHKQKALVLYFKDIAILTLNNQTIKRSWVSKDSAKGVYNFLLQFQDNGLTLYQIDPQSWKAVIKWSDYETRENLDQEL